MKKFICLFLFIGLVAQFNAQLKPQNGVAASSPQYIAFKNAKIYISPQQVIEDGILLIKNDKVVSVGKKVKIPSNAVVIDCSNKVIVPSFIELYSNVGLTTLAKKEKTNSGAYYWNEAVRPENDASNEFQVDAKSTDNLLRMGFGLALTHHQDGIVRGSAALIALGNSEVNKQLIQSQAGLFYSFNKGTSSNSYPSSQMGAIALLRQAFYDLDFYHSTTPSERNISLEEWKKKMQLPSFFKSEDKWEILRADKIAKEFNQNWNYIGTGKEYAWLPSSKKLNGTVVIPINYPEAYDVKDPYIAKQIPLNDLKHWELAPMNAKILADNKISFAITTDGISKPDLFWSNLRKTLSKGSSVEQILTSLTTKPAEILGLSALIGDLNSGKLASFSVYSDDPFVKDGEILSSWILGKEQTIKNETVIDTRGTYVLTIAKKEYSFEISGSKEKPTGKVTSYKTSIDSKTNLSKTDTLYQSMQVNQRDNDVVLQFNLNDGNYSGSLSLHGKLMGKEGGIIEGDALLPDGRLVYFAATKTKPSKEKDEKPEFKIDTSFVGKVWFPNMGFGQDSLPKSNSFVFENVTAWTNEAEGIMSEVSVVIENGKIKYVGKEKSNYPKNAIVINGKGKHLTNGIIDEHSHIAISKGVNEGSQAITAEVSIADVVNSDDINIYRQLAGGVTSAQLLHGSANPIGGQSALIKLKWGHRPEDLLMPNADGFIKCALGENVKQSNWGDYNTSRFPQTRMGVEQVFYDGFNRARAYQKEWENYQLKGGIKPRKDLELEVLSQILAQKRFITCHSYVQSEINMLMHVADSMGIRINTFTHILEGYKVADKMKKHGVGGSTFSDWWAYKFEVNDAIPYNAKLMADQGVIVAINSDDAEMGRRLNQEAAKSVKYGGMSEEEAWKMVTLNPAKLLHLDNRLGSIKIGKDADLVLWDSNPLSTTAKVDLTMIEGAIYFERKEDEILQKRNDLERARIISKMLKSNEKGEQSKPFVKKGKRHFHCNTLGEEGTDEENLH
ncbi:MAG: amidohydrolase family protein [Bacteroidota bacterium]